MKIEARGIERFLARPDAGLEAVLIYGPDQGLVRERADSVMRWATPDLSDPFRVTDLPGAAIVHDPARLNDELMARSLIGGRRAVRVRDGTDAVTEAVRQALGNGEGPERTLLVVEAGDLGPRSTLRGLFEKAAFAAAVPCYVDDPGAIARLVRQGLAAQGASIDGDALQWIVDRLGADRAATRSEIEKLALFAGQGGTIGLDDAIALSGDGASSTIDEIALCAGAGDAAGVDRLLARALNEGASAITILRAVARHFERLHAVGGNIAAGKTADAAIAGLRPPLFFKLRDAFRAQLRRWPPSRAAIVIDRLIDAEVACKSAGAPDAAICGNILLTIARGAATQRR